MLGCIKSAKNEYPCIHLQLEKWDMKILVELQKFMQNKGYNVKICIPYSEGLLYEMFYVPISLLKGNVCNFFCRTFNLDMFVFVDFEKKKIKLIFGI